MKRESQPGGVTFEEEPAGSAPREDAEGAEPLVVMESAEDAEGEEALGEEPLGEGGETLLELLLAEHSARVAREEAVALPARIDGVMIGTLTSFGEGGAPVVTFPGAPAEGFGARAMAALGAADLGAEVALMFEGGDPRRPVVMGRMHTGGASAPLPRPEARADGERIELSAEREIVLRCGKASITLTRSGKIIIRGAYLLSRSSGVHRIQGGTVQIN